MSKLVFTPKNLENLIKDWVEERITYGKMIEIMNDMVEPHILKAFEEGTKYKENHKNPAEVYYRRNYTKKILPNTK